jgi:homoserine dehydrogenase
MAEPLKVGLAGLGTVGTAVVHLLEHGRDKLTARCGRPIEVVALSARSRGKKRDIDLKKFRWVADPVALAADPRSTSWSRSSAAPAIRPSAPWRPRLPPASRW